MGPASGEGVAMPGRIRSVVGERECRRTMTPTVTIIMPTYNEAAAVPAAFSRLDGRDAQPRARLRRDARQRRLRVSVT